MALKREGGEIDLLNKTEPPDTRCGFWILIQLSGYISGQTGEEMTLDWLEEMRLDKPKG